jgi:hypothetical protein
MLDARRLWMLDAREVSSAYYLSLSTYLQDRVMPLAIKGLPMKQDLEAINGLPIKGLPTIEPLD